MAPLVWFPPLFMRCLQRTYAPPITQHDQGHERTQCSSPPQAPIPCPAWIAEAFKERTLLCSCGATPIRRYCCSGNCANVATLQATRVTTVASITSIEPASTAKSKENDNREAESTASITVIVSLYPQRSAA